MDEPGGHYTEGNKTAWFHLYEVSKNRLIEKEYILFLHFTFTGLVHVCVGEDSLESLGWHGSNQSILKESNPEYLLEGLMLKLNL